MAKRSSAARKPSTKPPKTPASKYYRVLVEMSPHENVRLVGDFGLEHSCMPQPAPSASGTCQLHAFAGGAVVTKLRKAGRKVTVLADADAEGARLRKHVGKGDRFEGGRSGPPGVGELV